MKDTAWRHKLVEADWNFSKCQNYEWEQCLTWELFREREQAANGGAFPDRIIREYGSALARMAAKFGNGKGKLVKQDFRPYIDKRQSELWRPIKQDEHNLANYLSNSWHGVVRHYEEELEEAETHLSTVIMGEDKTTELAPISIPWHWRDELIVEAFRHWLKDNRPPEIEFYTPPKTPTGRGSKAIQLQAKLKSLAAWRLLQHYVGNRHKALAHGEQYLGKGFAHASAWTDAKKVVDSLLKQPPPWAGIRFK